MDFTEKTRLKAVLGGCRVDRPPVICPGGMMSAATTAVLLHAGGGDFHNDPVMMAEMAEAIRRETGFENLGVPFCMTAEAEALGSNVDLGDVQVEPCVIEYGAGTLADILQLPKPDPRKDGRMAVILEAIRLLAARHNDVPVIGNITGPLSLATSVIDPLYFFRLLRKNPAEVHETLDYLSDYLSDFARCQIAAGADVIAISDPTATGEILGGTNFQRFMIPVLQRLVREIRAVGAGVIVHICGDATVLLDTLRSIEGSALSFDAMVDLTVAKAKLPESPVMGNISTQLLHMGSPERIRQQASIRLESGTDIIAPACGISLSTPRGNLAALTDTVKRYKRP